MSRDEKIEKDEVTINIGVPRALHRRLSITCAVLDVSLKAALMAGAALWIDQNAHAVAKALPLQPDPAPTPKKPRGKLPRNADEAPSSPRADDDAEEDAPESGAL